jgi:UDP-N-acetylmuramate--alanine ligase
VTAGAERPAGWEAHGAAMVRSAPTDRVPAFAELGRVHLIGIAGAGMSALARIMLDRGVPVSGCEVRESAGVSTLREAGADVFVPQSLDHLDHCDTVVYSTAIDPQQFELRAARERGLLVLRRAAGLGAMVAGHRAVAVAGTHGKTSAASLLVVAAQAAGLDPSYAIGANLASSGVSGHAADGQLFVVEADESDSSFLLLSPALALVTNVEADHLENHGTAAAMFGAYRQFVDRIEPDGLLVCCADDEGARQLAAYARGAGLRVLSYGEAADAEVRLTGIEEGPDAVRFTLAGAGQTFTVRGLLGRHMALNATGVLCLLRELGVEDAAAVAAWAEFAGIARRFQLRGTAGGVRVYDDYAHHPTEVAAQLAAARAVAASTGGRLVAVFQPGRYSRTQILAGDFGRALAGADLAVVLDVFAADEEPIPGVSGALVAGAVPLPSEQVVYIADRDAVPARIAELVRPGDLVLTMGIGDVYLLCPQILVEISDRQGAGR